MTQLVKRPLLQSGIDRGGTCIGHWESTLVGGYDGIRGGSIPFISNDGANPSSPKLGSVAESGLSQNPAKIPCRVIGTVGSNSTTSTMVNLSPSEKESLGSSPSLRQVFRSRE